MQLGTSTTHNSERGEHFNGHNDEHMIEAQNLVLVMPLIGRSTQPSAAKASPFHLDLPGIMHVF